MDDSRERKSLSLPSYRERLVEESRKGGGRMVTHRVDQRLYSMYCFLQYVIFMSCNVLRRIYNTVL